MKKFKKSLFIIIFLSWISVNNSASIGILTFLSPPGSIISLSEQVKEELTESPSLGIIGSKVFAVHATHYYPQKGVVKARVGDITSGRKYKGDEPPSFGPTIHFSLGGLVRPHEAQSLYVDRETYPYAVIVPLKILFDQLINISTQDTFILGNLTLTDECILLVPKGKKLSKLPPNITIKQYDKKKGLRASVERVIKESGGWDIRMHNNSSKIGSVAYIGNTEINSSKFFNSLIEQFKFVSYGTGIHSEVGDAFRFGLISQLIHNLMVNYDKLSWIKMSTGYVRFNRALIMHNLKRLESVLAVRSFPSHVVQVFEEKKQKLLGWINIIDADLKIRERFGRTINIDSDEMHYAILQRKSDPEKLWRYLETLIPSFPAIEKVDDIYPFMLVDRLRCMPQNELSSFLSDNDYILEQIDRNILYVYYAISRWLIIKTSRAKKEGLIHMFNETLPKVGVIPKKAYEEGIFEPMVDFLSTGSNRLEVALEILREPSMKQYLSKHYGFEFDKNGPQTLVDLLHAHTVTNIIFELPTLSLNKRQRIAYKFLKKIGVVSELSYDKEKVLSSFKHARRVAKNEVKYRIDRLKRNLQTIFTPMKTARKRHELLVGDYLNLYEELLQDNKKAIIIFKKVGLGKEFRFMFPRDELFWDSDLSLFEIFQRLTKDSRTSIRSRKTSLRRNADNTQDSLRSSL